MQTIHGCDYLVAHSDLQEKLHRIASRDPMTVIRDLEKYERQDTDYQTMLRVANDLYAQDPDWVTFFREVLGIDGIVRKSFSSFEKLTRFEQSEEFDQIQRMLVRLRRKQNTSDFGTEPKRIITVRLPKSMHDYLRTEAHDLRTSMNRLCIAKLLQVISEDMIPNEVPPDESGNREAATGLRIIESEGQRTLK